jgi:hypothetical protein
LNIEWLSKYFKIEQKLVLFPQEEIIDKGGMIFLPSTMRLGTVSLLKMNDTEFD